MFALKIPKLYAHTDAISLMADVGTTLFAAGKFFFYMIIGPAVSASHDNT